MMIMKQARMQKGARGERMTRTTASPRPRSGRRLVRAASLFVLSLLLLQFVLLRAEDDDEEEEPDMSAYVDMNRMQLLRAMLVSDFANDPVFMAQEEAPISANDAARHVLERLTSTGSSLEARLTGLFEKATTPECRAKIAEHFGYFFNALGQEEALPFADVKFKNTCGEDVYRFDDLPPDMDLADILNRTYQPPREDAIYIDDPADLKICFGILTHGQHPTNTIRLIESLYEPGHVFVVHVDLKYPELQEGLRDYAKTRDHVHLLKDPYRVRANWGGFSLVNATLQLLQYSMGVHSSGGGDEGGGRYDHQNTPLEFDKWIHLSGSTYPVASNAEIRHRLSSFPLDANFFNVIMQPARPSNYVWHYFVECDDALHRIHQLPPLNTLSHGAEIFTASQWFILSRDFAEYLATMSPGSFIHDYVSYAEHAVVADESFFGTILRHTPYCHKHTNKNFLHLQFDRWESALPAVNRDPRKCPMRNPDHCGRSPTVMTLDYVDILELSDDLFARKFDDTPESQVKDIIDAWRTRRQASVESGADPTSVHMEASIPFEGHGVMILARETANDATPLCLGLGDTGNAIQLVPCFHDWVPRTLGEEWETGAVILSETRTHVRWDVGPCTSDGSAERLDSAEMQVTLGNYSETGPRCMLKQMDGVRAGRCYDCEHGNLQPGGMTQVYPCVKEWFQFISFGDGRLAPKNSLYSSIPKHTVHQIHTMGHEQSPYMCFGVYGRGTADEVDWEAEEEPPAGGDEFAHVSTPLSDFNGEDIVTTQCTNTGAVIEWLFVPYVEDPSLAKVDASPTEEDTDGSDDVKTGL